MIHDASQSMDLDPARVPAGPGGRWAIVVVCLSIVVVAIGLLGPRPSTAPGNVTPVQVAAGAAEVLEPPSRVAPDRPTIKVAAIQVGAEVIVEGQAPADTGPVVVTLEFAHTELATVAVAPRAGRFTAVLRPRVPLGGLIGRLVIRASGPTTALAIDEPFILAQTTVGRRTVDPATGRTLMPGSAP